MLRFQLALLSLAPLVMLAGCPGGDDDPDAADDTGDGTTANADDGGSTAGPADDDTAAGSSGSGGPDLAELYACEEAELAIAQPFGGPGFDPVTGELVNPAAEYVVSTTQLLPKPDPAAQQEFLELTNAVVAQLMTTPGFLGVSLAFEPTCGFARTLTVWESEEAMFAFVGTGAHVEAMGKTFDVGVTGRVTSFTATADEMPPTWEAAIAEIAEVDPIGGY